MKQPLKIKQERCTGCGKCVSACPFAALSMQEGVAVVEPGLCCLCGACVKTCPFSAIILEDDPSVAAEYLEHFKDIWVFAEQKDGVLHESAFELIAKGRELADEKGVLLCAVILGCDISGRASSLIAAGVDRVYLADDPLLKEYESSLYADALAHLIERYKPEVVLAAATSVGRGFFAKTAVKCRTGLTADCTALSMESETGNLVQTRPAFGGNIMARIITPNHRPQMATVRPHVFKRGPDDPGRNGEIVVERLALSPPLTHLLKSIRGREGVNLSEADIIVAGGRGLKNRSNFDMLFSLADKLGGVVAASRACVDAGWISASHQVGQTGKTVSPKIYLAFGISGAVQHLEGMRSSDTIVAVNNDPHAPIFDVADISIVGDLFEILPLLMQSIGQRA